MEKSESKIKNDVAPMIVGILKRFEYFTANSLLNPKNLIHVIIEPDLLTPGIRATHWNKPINSDNL